MKTQGKRASGSVLFSYTGQRARNDFQGGRRFAKRFLALSLAAVMVFSMTALAVGNAFQDPGVIVLSSSEPADPSGSGEDQKNPEQPGDGEDQENPKPSGDGEDQEKPEQPGDGEDQENPKPSEDGEDQEDPKPSGDGEDQENPKPSEDSENQENPKPSGDGEDQKNPEPSGDGEDQENPKPSGDGEDQEKPEQPEDGKAEETPVQENAAPGAVLEETPITAVESSPLTLEIPVCCVGDVDTGASAEFTLSGDGIKTTTAQVSPDRDGAVLLFSVSDEDDHAPAQGRYTFTARNDGGSSSSLLADERACTVTYTVSDSGEGSVDDMAFTLDGETVGPQEGFVLRFRQQGSVWSEKTVDKANEIMAGLTLEEKIGQMFLVHYPGDGSGSIAQATERINKWHPGGYLVFGAMFINSTPEIVKGKTAAAQAASLADSGVPILFSVDEEGGKVVRISDKPAFGHAPFDYPQNVAAGGVDAVYRDAADKAEFLKNLGLTINHAPVADVSGSSGYIYPRTYGGDGLHNAPFVAAAVSGHESNGVGTTMKHFPGYGGTSSDTHNGFAINDLSLASLEYNDLLPFWAGMGAGGKGLMVTHNIINALDTENPASLSPAVINYAREVMGFDGIIMTDDLNMDAVTAAVGKTQASLLAIQAGVDMPMTAFPDAQIPPVIAAVENGTLSVSRIEESCRRVLCWKIELGLFDDVDPDPGPVIPEENEAEWTSGDQAEKGTFADMWAKAAAQGARSGC